LTQAPLTQRQRWVAAVLTKPGTFLAEHSAATCFGFWEWDGPYETVVRQGSGGKRRTPALLVAHSKTLEGQTTRKDGLPIVTPERALVDLAPGLETGQLGRVFRESIRLKCTTADNIAQLLDGQRGTSFLADGPQFHLFADEDARKQARWEGAGNTVRRIPSGDVYDRPQRLLALATQPNVQKNRQ
jgi:hypothetical protein